MTMGEVYAAKATVAAPSDDLEGRGQLLASIEAIQMKAARNCTDCSDFRENKDELKKSGNCTDSRFIWVL
jgi:hypothetical protein